MLVVQIHGSKRWRSYGAPIRSPVEEHRRGQVLPTEIVCEYLLKPGDILYLPRGDIHDAVVVEGKNSVHLTIAINPRRGVDFLSWLAKLATEDESLRMDLTRLGGERGLRRHERQLKERLRNIVNSASLSAYLNSDDSERPPRSLFSIGQDDRLAGDTFIVPAPRRRIPLLTDDKEDVSVTIGGEQYRLSAPARRALSLLLERNGLKFEELLTALGTTAVEETLRKAVLELVKHGLAALEPTPEK